MSVIKEDKSVNDSLLSIAKKMMIASRTAPKARGVGNIEMLVVEGDDIKKLSSKMEEIGNTYKLQGVLRDSKNILSASVIFIIGTRIQSLGLLKCGNCGFENCNEKDKFPEHPCAFNTGDLGIAIGSAVSVAMDNRVDNRVMYTIGLAVKEMSLMSEDIKIIYGIPLSASSKNVFFDR